MKKCLVLGAGGFLGKSLCRELVNKYEVIAFDRVIPNELVELDGAISFVEGDFVGTEDFSSLLEGVDKVIHLISTTIPQEETSNIDVEIMQNIVPTVRLLEGMVKMAVPEIVFASSGGTIYGETGDHANDVTDELHPICAYGVHKKVIESYLEFYGVRYGINYKIMRISNPYGVGQDPNKPQGVIPIFVHRLLNDMPITIFGDGNSQRDYIYIPDLMKAFVKVLEYKGDMHIFNIGSGEAHTLHEIIEVIEQKIGKSFVEINYQEQRKCDVSKNVLNVDRTRDVLSWNSEIGLIHGIESIVECYVNQGNK